MIEFIFPTEKHKNDVLSFYGEFADRNETCIGFADWQSYEKWLTNKRNRLTGTDLPHGHVPEIFMLCIENGKLIGVFSLKLKMTDYLTNFGGHIGYAVRPTARNRGLATEILQKGLDLSREKKLGEVILVCDDDNIASEKVIRKNGGVFSQSPVRMFFERDTV